jgi:hypothetical protein
MNVSADWGMLMRICACGVMNCHFGKLFTMWKPPLAAAAFAVTVGPAAFAATMGPAPSPFSAWPPIFQQPRQAVVPVEAAPLDGWKPGPQGFADLLKRLKWVSQQPDAPFVLTPKPLFPLPIGGKPAPSGPQPLPSPRPDLMAVLRGLHYADGKPVPPAPDDTGSLAPPVAPVSLPAAAPLALTGLAAMGGLAATRRRARAA